MLNRIIDFTLAYRWIVLTGILVLLAAGGYALYTIPVEAFDYHRIDHPIFDVDQLPGHAAFWRQREPDESWGD